MNNTDRSPRFIIEFDINSGDVKIDKNQYVYPKPLEVYRGELVLFIFASPSVNSFIDRHGIAKNIINNEPFAVILADDLIKSQKPCLKQLVNIYNEKESNI